MVLHHRRLDRLWCCTIRVLSNERVEDMSDNMFAATVPNRENMNKLADALVSGKYEQGEGVLRTDKNTFCCLGVACDISGLGEWTLELEDSHYEYVIGKDDGGVVESGASLFTDTMCHWLGVSTMGMFRILGDADNQNYTLTDLNDSGEFSFSMIADILRSEAIEWIDVRYDD